VRPDQGAQLGRHSAGDHEIRGRHLRLKLILNPTLAVVMLAMGATSVAARVRHAALLAAGAALGQHALCKLGAAALESGQGSELTGQQTSGITLQKLGLKALNQVGQRDGGLRRHLTTPQCKVNRLIKPLMQSLALATV